MEAAVGCQCSAGHEAGIFGAEEGDAARYFLWLPEAPHMFALTNAIEGFGAEIALDLFVQRRVNDAGAQQIHAYAVFGQLCGGGGRQPQLAGLGRGVCAGSGATQERVDRSDIDDRSAIARRQHSARFMLETQEIAAKVYRHHAVPVIVWRVDQRIDLGTDARVVDGKIEPSMRVYRMRHHRFDVAGLCDIGDFLGLTGVMMRTKTGELTLRVKQVVLLSKAIRPLPVPKVEVKDGERIVHDEVTDKEFRYRQRYADLVLNPEVAQVFRQRNAIFQTTRNYLTEQGFLEVETPTLQSVYGGANATPFTTHHNALDQRFYLRISNELYLKRLIAGGFDAVFEFVKDFRNEGIDRTHNPEFSMLEFYQANVDYTEMMGHCEEIYSRCALALHGTTQFEYDGQIIDVKSPWQRMTMAEAIATLGNLAISGMSDMELQNLLDQRGWTLDGSWNRGLAMQLVFEETCEPQLIQPIFITDHPKATSPLCKTHRSNPELIERFEAFINGWEMANVYSELTTRWCNAI